MTLKVECAAILAGGKSSRMGREKALLPFENRPLIAHIAAILAPIFPRICVVTANSEAAKAANLPQITDRYPNCGPLGGIHAALLHFGAPVFVVACDMPFLNADFVRFLSENLTGNALVPLSEGGFEPLHAIYSPNCAPLFENWLQNDGKMPSMRCVLEEIGADFVPANTARRFEPDLKCFVNWNTPDDLRANA